MKDQYFGDINDYRKYGLLRAINDASALRTLVAWMLTPNDGSTDGKFTDYLDKPNAWRTHDPELFDGLNSIMSNSSPRSVSQIEDTNLLPGAEYHSNIVPESATYRAAWFQSLLGASSTAELVFLDPDNGLEIQSCPYGRKKSPKFAYWREVEALWRSGKSLLVYQHFIREKRPQFVQRMLRELQRHTPDSFVAGFATKHVLFLLALQPDHRKYHGAIVATVRERWSDQIIHWNVASEQQNVSARVFEHQPDLLPKNRSHLNRGGA